MVNIFEIYSECAVLAKIFLPTKLPVVGQGANPRF
jgi:hypothetical protein